MRADAPRGQQRDWLLQSGVLTGYDNLMWVPGAKPGAFARAAGAPDRGALPAAPLSFSV